MQLLLREVAGLGGFWDISTIAILCYDTFREACFKYGLLEDNSQWDSTLAEGILTHIKACGMSLLFCSKTAGYPIQLFFGGGWGLKLSDPMSEEYLQLAKQRCPNTGIGYNNMIYSNVMIEVEYALLKIGEWY